MQILLASAKIMKERCKSVGVAPHSPLFQKQAFALAEDLSHCTAVELSQMFSCSPAIGEQNRQRFKVFGTDEAEIMPAVLTYWGQAYKHLRADLMETEDLLWADSHLWISSCLYGLLRPLDGILVYLDTEEFRTLFDWKRVVSEVRTIIEPEFHVLKNGKLTTPSVWAKTCRGAMTRFIIENRISDPSQLKEFSYEGFSFEEEKDEKADHEDVALLRGAVSPGSVCPLICLRLLPESASGLF